MNKILLNKFKQSDSTSYKFLIGILTALNYAIYPALITIFVLSANTTTTPQKISMGFALVTAKELFTFFVYFIASGRKNFISAIKKDLFSKNGLIIAIAGLFGGPVGYSFETIGALYVGGAIAAMLTTTSTIFTAIFEVLFLKRKFSKSKTAGIILAAGASVCIAFFTADALGWKAGAGLGIMFVLLASVSWTIENILMDYGMGYKGRNVSSNSALKIKLFTSAIIMLIFFMPVASAATGQIGNSYDFLGGFFNSWTKIGEIIMVAVFLCLARFFFLRSVKMQGATVGFIWYTASAIVTPILVLILHYAGVDALPGDVSVIESWWFWTFGALMVSGIVLSTIKISKTK